MEESTQEVVKGSVLADQAGEALRSIYGAVDRQAKMIEGIAKAANERAQTSEAVATAMTRIADITRQTNAATQDTTAAVSYLAELAEQLRASVATFRLPEQTSELPPLLPQVESAYPPMLNLPNLSANTWGDEIPPLPALPAAPPSAFNGMGMGSEFAAAGMGMGNGMTGDGYGVPGAYDYNDYSGGYDSYYGAPPSPYRGAATGPQQPRQPQSQGFDADQGFGPDQMGNGPHPSDLYQ
jgi:hypothetical protein